MNVLISQIFSTILQILLFVLIPFIVFLFRKDKGVGFTKYVGLYVPTKISVVYSLAVSVLFVVAGVGIFIINPSLKEVAFSPATVTGQIKAIGPNFIGFSVLFIIAIFKTSFSEEILFRGFIAKQLIQKLGFTRGNILQAAFFGIIHLLLFLALTKASGWFLLFIFLFSSFAGWCIGFIKERYANGSIIPGWIAHGVGNVISYTVIAFLM